MPKWTAITINTAEVLRIPIGQSFEYDIARRSRCCFFCSKTIHFIRFRCLSSALFRALPLLSILLFLSSPLSSPPPYLLSLPPPPCAVVSHSYESKIIYSRSILLANKPRWLNFTIQLFQTISKADLFDFHHSHSFEFLVSEIWNTFTLRFIRWSVLHDLLTNCFARVRFHWTNCWHFIKFSIFLFCFFSFTVFGCSTGNSKYNSSFCIYFAADDDDGVVSPCWLVTTL